MATLALGIAGAAIGGALLPSVSILGATLTGAAVGRAIGGLAGSYIDQALFGASGQGRVVDGPRLASLHVMASRDGAPMPRLYGRARIAGEVIWATNFEEVASTTTSGGGGKGLGGGGGPSTTQTTYSYFANFAVGLCEGPITRIGTVWADGKVLDLSAYTHRLYTGSEQQLPDSLIQAKEGAGLAPAYRGIAYVVFERMALAKFGNRLPQLAFEVFRSVDGFEQAIKAVTVTPGAGEFVYDTAEVQRDLGGGAWAPENTHTLAGKTDWAVAIDQLQDALPNAGNLSLVVSWFGNDLRAANCLLRPAVDNATKSTNPLAWSVAGVTRPSANVVSTSAGAPAFGGTPSDHSVTAAIQDLSARGLKTTFYPFVLMDIPAGNGLPDPYGAAAQAAYPWRGRITVSPAAGQPGTVDKTAAAAAQLAIFMGTVTPANFAISGGNVSYSGPAEWSYRRMILHYAFLCKAAGGVDAFLIGSELRGLTTARSAAGTYPFVAALAALAADVKSVLGTGTKVTYAADWSEYFGHQPTDGSGDVRFHLDPLWASSAIDAVGIDVYWPLADWRDGATHLDALAGASSLYDLNYLSANVSAGEGYDWYYASDAARTAQSRTPITDGAGKPWVFRFKDIANWWSHQHFDRPGGIESTTATAWVPQGKPIWFTEVGCPAVDKGANQPNVFVDAKSAESKLPYFSSGQRDDFMQRRYLQAILGVFANGIGTAANPISNVYGAPMVDPARMVVYTWDARPYPAFPYATGVWSDGVNWQRGHWITGRIAAAALDKVVAAILTDYGFSAYSASGLVGLVEGYVIDRVMSARGAIQPLELAYFFDSYESGDHLAFAQRGARGPVAQLSPDDLVELRPGAEPYHLVRKQDTDLPHVARLGFLDADQGYRSAAAESRRLAGRSSRISNADLPLVMRAPTAQAIADSLLQDAWASRQQATFSLPARLLALEPSDVVDLLLPGRTQELRITALTDGLGRAVDSLSIQRAVYGAAAAADRSPNVVSAAAFGQPAVAFMDLPLLRGDEPPTAPRVAATQAPWPGGVAFYRSTDGIAFTLNTTASRQATLGVTASMLPAGPVGRWDRANALLVQLNSGTLGTQSPTAVLAGANIAAIETTPGVFEVIQFVSADLVSSQTYRLGTLLRGQAGTEAAMVPTLSAGARFVLLDGAVALLDETADQMGLAQQWRYGPANRPIGNLAYRTDTRTFTGIGRRPLSPSHVRGARSGGDLAISWKRRTRIGGDSWSQIEVPLAEDSEAYQIDVLSGASVVRTLSATSPAVTYTAAQQTADFGAAQAAVPVKVYQISQSFGRGTPRAATV